MAITLADAKLELNIDVGDISEDDELELYVDAANEWVASKVEDTTTARAQLATRMLVAHLWETQRGPASSPLDDDGTLIRGAGYAVPNRVKELLGLASDMALRLSPSASFPDAGEWPDPIAS